MKRIADLVKTIPAPCNYFDMRGAADALWRKEIGEPLPDDAWVIMHDELTARQGIPVEPKELAVVLTPEEAKAVVKAVGGDDKAADIKAEICAKVSVAEVPIKEVVEK